MNCSIEQINIISSNILLKDVKAYINANLEDYEKFLHSELRKEEK